MSPEEALEALAKRDPVAAKAIDLFCFHGTTYREAAPALSMTLTDFRRIMKRAIPLLRRIMGADEADSVE